MGEVGKRILHLRTTTNSYRHACAGKGINGPYVEWWVQEGYVQLGPDLGMDPPPPRLPLEQLKGLRFLYRGSPLVLCSLCHDACTKEGACPSQS